MNNTNEFFFSTDDVETLYKSKIFYARLQRGDETYCHEVTAFFSKNKLNALKDWLRDQTNGYHFKSFEMSDYRQFMVDETNEVFVDFSIDTNKVDIKIKGSISHVEKIEDVIGQYLETYTSHIEWYYSSNGHSSSETLPIRYDNLPVQEMYPFLGDKAIEAYYDEYLESPAAVLLLMGPPGTGKTTFIKGLLNYSKESACLSYNAQMLGDDEIFVRFLSGPMKFMIIEDSDAFLQKRTDGNTMMHRFLNVSDGLVSVRGKKLIFTSNLPSVGDIDEALTRKGRCYDILQFDTLDREQAHKLADRFDVPLADGKEFTIAEVLARNPDRALQIKKFGF